MIKRNVFIGFLTGIAATLVGIILYISFFSEGDLQTTLAIAANEGYLGKIIALGAILNFLPFFVFLRKNLIYHARGVVLASVLTAVVIAFTLIV